MGHEHRESTALIKAVREGHEEVVELLLDYGASINQKDSSGFSSIIFATMKEHIQIVKLLVSRGADVNDKDKDVKVL